jgi:structural maintenance of chromosome 3 (chondroitin sulfate proteoglycan 6)
MDELAIKIRDSESALEQLQTEHVDDVRMLEHEQKNTERYLAKRALLSQKRDECNQKIRELGALPEEAFEKYTNTLTKKVHPYPLTCVDAAAHQISAQGERKVEKVWARQQEGL